MNTRIVVVDDHPILRQGLRQTLSQQPDLVLSGEASTGQAALQMVKELSPNLIIMDIHLPDINGIELSSQILAWFPNIKIIIFSADANRTLVDQALKIGVCGYLLKEGIADELIRAIHQVIEGRLYLCPHFASAVIGDYKNSLISGSTANKSILTERDKIVLRYIAEGLQTKEIAAQLNLSVKAVEKTRSRLMRKLKYRSVAELIRYAVREGMVEV